MEPLVSNVQHIALLFHEGVHQCNRGGLIVIGPDVHALHAQPFVIGQEFHFGKVCLLLSLRFLNSPVKILPCHKIRQADDRDPMEVFLMRVVHSFDAFLPPETLQRRHDIVKIALDLVIAFFAHLDGIGDAVQQFNRLLVFAALDIGISLATDRNIIHARHRYDAGFVFGHIELFIFFLEIKNHIPFLSTNN